MVCCNAQFSYRHHHVHFKDEDTKAVKITLYFVLFFSTFTLGRLLEEVSNLSTKSGFYYFLISVLTCQSSPARWSQAESAIRLITEKETVKLW